MVLPTHFTLNSGYKIPALGFGTWKAQPNEVIKAVEIALKNNYRHIDAAAIYGNEEEIGNAIVASGVPREQIFVTSKLWNSNHHSEDVEVALDKTLKDLQLDYLDLYLMHWPLSFARGKGTYPKTADGKIELDEVPLSETWKAMEALVAKGKVRSIGVSNFTIERIEELLQTAKIVPAVNQIEAHPVFQQPKLFEYLKSKNILITAYSPLGNNTYGKPRDVDHPEVISIAKKLNKEPAHLLLSWGIQRGTSVLSKSVTPSRIVSNYDNIFELPREEFLQLNALDANKRLNNPVQWGADIFNEY